MPDESQASLNSFKEQIMQCRQLVNSPQGFIKVYFSKLKTQVETDREVATYNFQKTIETFKKGINTHYMLMANELDKIQEDCLTSLSSHENRKKKRFEQALKEYEEKFQVLQEDLESIDEATDAKRREAVDYASNNFKLKLEALKEDFEAELLMNRAFNYKSNKLGIDVLEPVKTSTPKEEFGSFSFIKKGFKEFSQTMNAEFRSAFYVFNDIKWYAEMENEDGENMGAYVYCLRPRPTQEITTLLGFKLNNRLSSSKNEFGRTEFKFTTDSAHGFPHFISFKDGFYDEQSDSIDMTIFVQVKYIREYSTKVSDEGLKTDLPNTSAKLALRNTGKIHRSPTQLMAKPAVNQRDRIYRFPSALIAKQNANGKSSKASGVDNLPELKPDPKDKDWFQLHQLWDKMISNYMSNMNLSKISY